MDFQFVHDSGVLLALQNIGLLKNVRGLWI
jgi:hypothetical protein